MDIVAITQESTYAEQNPTRTNSTYDHSDFNTLYKNCLNVLRDLNNLKTSPKNFDSARAKSEDRIKFPNGWALRFFAYDRLALVNVKAYVDVGGCKSFVHSLRFTTHDWLTGF